MDVYVSGLSLRTNRTTTLLTIIATVILPPSLIAGIYGMNFAIPEVHAASGYYFCIVGMFLISGTLLAWLKLNGHIELE
jgi:magnesium transporter